MFRNISIIGDGGMGTVLGVLLVEKKIPTRIWGYNRRQLAQIAKNRENKKFLPGHKLPKTLKFEPDDRRIMAGADLLIIAVPCQYIRSVLSRLKVHIPPDVPVVSVAKGIENGSLLRPTQIIAEVLNPANSRQGTANSTIAALSGPTIADELIRKLPATACVAARDKKLAKQLQQTFSSVYFRIYTNTDITGVELAGAMKNIIAIAAGIIDGTGFGNNAKAALLTRGLAEITRLGLACGARQETFAGLTGLGDLITTCFSPKGRNRSFGERIGKGQTTRQAEAATESVVEGVATCKSVVALARRYNIEMPITRAVYDVLFKDKPVHKAIEQLMKRRLKAE
jgi:glycerol-3-phosphate dehydrogenase (NAD(P)+)